MRAIKHKICRSSDVAENQMKTFEVDGERVLVARVDGEFYAVSDTCTHLQHQSLSIGIMDNEKLTVECPLHGGVFDLVSGAAIDGPATEPLATYRVTVLGEDIYIEPTAG